MAKHTPGPWEWKEIGIDDELSLIPVGYPETPHTDVIMTLGFIGLGIGERGTEPSPSNARLIAAAPELLEALKCAKDGLLAAYPHADRIRDILQPIIAKVNAAFAKATGETT